MGLKVLVVDDSSTMRRMVTRTVKMSTIPIDEVFQAEHGQAALEILAEKKVDLVLVDLHMPVMDGQTMVMEMKKNPALADIPTIVVSSESSQKRIEEIREMGVMFIHKPFTPEDFHRAAHSIMEDFSPVVTISPDVLLKVGKDVLETMVFAIVVEGEESELTADEPVVSTLCRFSGPFDGEIIITLPEFLLREFQMNMLGEVDEDNNAGADALGEIANVVAGNILAEVAGPEAMFTLEHPEEREPFGDDISEEHNSATVRLQVDEGWVEISMVVSGASTNNQEVNSVPESESPVT